MNATYQQQSCDRLHSRLGFTLVELMVVLVIVALLSSLTLSGLAGVRQRAKADKTRSTIRKIDSIIQPMYESYATRRVPITVTQAVLTAAAANTRPRIVSQNRLQNLRVLMAIEMPDEWDAVNSQTLAGPTPDWDWAKNAVYRRYAAYKTANAGISGLYGPAETLMLILSVSGIEPDAMEQFRADEFGDIDGDGAKEFWDGWGRPIMWIRWPAAYASPLIDRSQVDPLDLLRVTGPTGPPFNAPGDWAMTPLIYSAGPDEAMNDPMGTANGYGIETNPPNGVSWLTKPNFPIQSTCFGNDLGRAFDAAAATDNITNYDLLKK